MKRQAFNRQDSEVWFEKIERAVHRVRRRDGALSEEQALMRALDEDAEARDVYERYCAPRGEELPARLSSTEGHGPKFYIRTPRADGGPGSVLVEVARLRSLTSGTAYEDALEEVMRDYPNLAEMYENS